MCVGIDLTGARPAGVSSRNDRCCCLLRVIPPRCSNCLRESYGGRFGLDTKFILEDLAAAVKFCQRLCPCA